MHFGHEGNPGQMLAEAIVQVLPDAALLARAYVEDGFFQMFALGDVDSSRDDVAGGLRIAGKQSAGPRNQALVSVASDPGALIVLRKHVGAQYLKDGAEAIGLLRRKKEIPDAFPLDLFNGISSGEFASRIEAQDASLAVENHYQRAYGVQDRRYKVAFLLSSSSTCLRCEMSKATP